MSLMVIYGDLGSGKTSLAVMLAINDERQVYANFNIKSDRFHALEPQHLHDINSPTLVIIDEAYNWLESRLSGKDINRYLSYVLFQSRKRQIDFIITAQLLSSIDLRFKSMADMYVLAEKTREGFRYTVMYPGRKHSRKVLTMTYGIAQRYFPFFDTYEKVDPIDDELILRVTPNRSQVIPELDKIIMKMLQEHPANKWTTGMVEDYCLENKHPHMYYRWLHNRIKRVYMKEEPKEGE